MSSNDTKSTLFHWHDFKLKIIAESVLVGLCAGLAVVAYRFAIEKTLAFAHYIYQLQRTHHGLIPLWFLLLAITGYIVGIIVEKEPMASGSGIPQLEGLLLRKLSMRWWSVLLSKFIGGILSIGAGLSLGREGPSIQIGAAVGQGFSRIFRRIKLEEKFLITSGASAGLAAAFNAPLAGVIFALEEIHKNFSPVVMTSALAASIVADFLSKRFFGMHPIFDFSDLPIIPLMDYGYLLLLGVLIGMWGLVFSKSLLKTQEIYGALHIPPRFKPVPAFLTAGFAGLLLPQILGGGSELVSSTSAMSLSIAMILLLLLSKFFFTMISYGSTAPGGIFLPLLVIGALSGLLYGNMLIALFGLDPSLLVTLMILAMAGYFTAIVKAPITGIVLITEMTGSFSHLLSISVVSLTAYVVADVMNSAPIYESLLNRMLKKSSDAFEGEKTTKVLIELAVCLGSVVDGKKVKDVVWPPNCLIVSIKRGTEEIIPNGDDVLCPGDYLIVLANEDDAGEIRECLSAATEEFAEQ